MNTFDQLDLRALSPRRRQPGDGTARNDLAPSHPFVTVLALRHQTLSLQLLEQILRHRKPGARPVHLGSQSLAKSPGLSFRELHS
jgi:hypothetical protein